MVSELQRQLALHRQALGVGSSSASASSSSRRQHAAPSLLFDPRKAASIDIATLRDVALTSLQSLSRREPLVEVLEPFFALSSSEHGQASSPHSRDFMTADQARVLDRRVALCCDLLGPFFLLQDAQYLLEYLLRQYAIHQHNQDALLALALPYHNYPIFVRLVRLLTIPPHSPWIFLERMRASGAPLQSRDFVKVILASPFLLQFLVDTVARVSSPLSPARLKDAGLSPLPSHLQDGKAARDLGNDEILLLPASRLPAQNTSLLSFFTLLVSDSIAAAPSLAAVRSLTPCLLPFLLSTLRPTSAVRTPELHASGVAILTHIAARATLDPAILVAAMQQLTQTLLLSTEDGLARLSASKENEIFSLLVLLADKQNLALQGTLPGAVTRRLTKWRRLAAAMEELLSVRQLNCAPFLRAFFKSLLSFFLSSSSHQSAESASFSPLQERLLSTAEALCAACVAAPASRARLGPPSLFSLSSLSQTQEASPSLIVIALTLFDSFRRAGQHALQLASEREEGEQQENARKVSASTSSTTLYSCVEKEHALFFKAVSRLLLRIDAANPLSLPKALTFFSRATEQEKRTEKSADARPAGHSSCEDIVLLLSHVFDGLPSLGCPLYTPKLHEEGSSGDGRRLSQGRDASGDTRVEGLSLFSALMASEAELRREGVRTALACFRRQEARKTSLNATQSDGEDASRDEQEKGTERGILLVELLLDRLQDEDPSLVVEAARGTTTLGHVLSPFVCLHRTTSVLLADLASLLPSPLAATGRALVLAAFFPGGSSAEEAGKGASANARQNGGASQCFAAAVLLVPRLRALAPALLRACAELLKQEAEKEETEDEREKFAGAVLASHLLPVALALAWGTSRPDAAHGEEEERTEEAQDREAQETEGEAGRPSALRSKRKAFGELRAGALDVLNAMQMRLERGNTSNNKEEKEQFGMAATQERLASSAAFHALVQHALLPLPSPPAASSSTSSSLRRMQSSLVAEAFLEQERRKRAERSQDAENEGSTSVTCMYTTAALLEISGATIVPSASSSAASSSAAVPLWMFHLVHLCEFLQRRLSAAPDAAESRQASSSQDASKTRPETRGVASSSSLSSSQGAAAPSFPRDARRAVKAVADGVAVFLQSRVARKGEETREKKKKQRDKTDRASGAREESADGAHAEDDTSDLHEVFAPLCNFFGFGEQDEPEAERERLERRLRGRILLLALSDLALFSRVVQSFLSSFQGQTLLLLAHLSQLLSRVSLARGLSSGAAQEVGIAANAETQKREEFVLTGGRECANWFGAAAIHAQASCLFPSSSCVSSGLWGPAEECELLAFSSLRQQIEVNLVDLSRALLAQAARLGDLQRTRRSKSEQKKGETVERKADTQDGEKGRHKAGGAERRIDAACVGILVLPLWLSVHDRAEGREVRDAVKLLLEELSSLLSSSEVSAASAPGRDGSAAHHGVTESRLKLWWRRLAHLGLVRRMRGGEGRPADGEERNPKMHLFLQTVLQAAPRSCLEFLSLFLSGFSSASSALLGSLPSRTSISGTGGPEGRATLEHVVFGSTVATASDSVAAFLCFALACLVQEGREQKAFARLLLHGAPSRLLSALLPALEEEVDAFVAEFHAPEASFEIHSAESRSPSFQSARSSPASPTAFSVASPLAVSPRGSWPQLSLCSKPSFFSPVIRLACQLLNKLGDPAVSLGSAALLGSGAASWKSGESLRPSRISPACATSLVCDILLPFLRSLSSPVLATSLRAFYLRPSESPSSAEPLVLGPSLSLARVSEVAQAAETLIDGVFASGILLQISEDLCLKLVLSVLRLASTAPQLATRLRLQDAEAFEGAAGPAGTGPEETGAGGTPEPEARPRSETLIPLSTLVRLVQAIGTLEGEATDEAEKADSRATQGGQAESACMRICARDALLADFVESQLQARSSLETETARRAAPHRKDAKSRRELASFSERKDQGDRDARESAEERRLARCSLGKVEEVLKSHLASAVRSEGCGAPSARSASEREGMETEHRATRRTLESLLSVCAAASSAAASRMDTGGKKSKKISRQGSEAPSRGDGSPSCLLVHEETLRGLAAVSRLLAQACATGGGQVKAGEARRGASSLVTPVLLAALLRSCASACDTAAGAQRRAVAELPAASLHRAVSGLLHALGSLLARAGLLNPRLVAAPLVLSGLRSYLPSLFAALNSLLSVGEKTRDSAAKSSEETPSEKAAERRAEEERRRNLVTKHVLGLVQMVVEPLCVAAFGECAKEEEKDCDEQRGRSERTQSQAAVADVVVAFGAVLGREALVGGCLTVLVKWETAFLKRRREANAGADDEEASTADEEEEDETGNAKRSDARQEGGESDEDEVLLNKKARKERRKNMRSGWGTRRALLERLKEMLAAHAGTAGKSCYGHQLLALAQLATGAVALQCEARGRLLPKASREKQLKTIEEEKEKGRDEGARATTEAVGGRPARNLPSCAVGRVTCMHEGLCDQKRQQELSSVYSSFFGSRGSTAEGRNTAEVYCRAASTAVLLVYEHLKKEGLPNLQRVAGLSLSAFALDGEGEEEAQSIQELVEALLSVKILAERRWLSGTASAKKRRELEDGASEEETELGRVFDEEAILKQRAELLLESVIRALSPLVGCMRIALGCLGVQHAFFQSTESLDELRSRFAEERAKARTTTGGVCSRPSHPAVPSRRSSLTESEDEEETQSEHSTPSIHLLLPSFPSALFPSRPSSLCPASRLLLADEAAHAAAEAVAEGGRFARSSAPSTSADFVFFSLLFRGLAGQLESCLGAGEAGPPVDGAKTRGDEGHKGTEDRLWRTLFASSSWTEASLTAPYALLLSILAKRLLEPAARSSSSSLPVTAAGVAAWQFATRLSRLAGGYLPEAFRDGALPPLLLTLKKASGNIPSQLALPSSVGRANLRSLVALATAATRCLLALALTSHGREGETRGAGMGQKTSRSLHAAALFLADFNAIFARLSLLLRKLLPSLLEVASQESAETAAGPRRSQDIFNRLLFVRDPRISELAICLLAALLGLLQRVGTDFFLPHASTLLHTTLLNPLLASALSCDARDASEAGEGRRGVFSPSDSSLAAFSATDSHGATDRDRRVAFECLRRLAAPRISCDASLQFYLVDASVELPCVRRLASEVLEHCARQSSAFGFSSSLFGGKREKAWRRLGPKSSPQGLAETRESALWRERPVVDTLLSALAAELGTSMRLQGSITLLLPSLHSVFAKSKAVTGAGQKKRAEKVSKASSETQAEDARVGFFSVRGLQDFQASRTIEILGTVIGAQPQARADAKRPVLTKLMVHLVHLCLSRAEESSARPLAVVCAGGDGKGSTGKEAVAARMQRAECLAELIYGGQVQNVHRQLLWGSDNAGDDRELFLNDLPEDEEEVPELSETGGKKSTKRRRDEGDASGAFVGEDAGDEASSVSLVHTLEQSARLLPPAAFAPSYLHRVEAALYCAFRSWSQKLSMQQLQAFLSSLLRSLRGPKRALLQPGADGEPSEASEESDSADEFDVVSKKRKRKAEKKRTDGTESLATAPASFSVREICGARLLVLFYTAAIRDFGSVGGVEALLEDLLADFQSALAACRDQALALVDPGLKDSGEKRERSASGSRGRVLESSATWFWFELGMPILLALVASLRSWKKDLSGALPPSLFERLLTCALDAADILAVLPRLPLPGYSRENDRLGLAADKRGERETQRTRAQTQRLSKLWFCALRSLVTGLFEHAFGDKMRVEELNLSLLEKVRSCGKANVHFAAARIYLHLWKRLGVAMVDTLNDSLQTLVELLESADDEVEMATREWVKAIENLTGESLDDKLKA
ncbi:conserved hypothetical protein [Neospora caninum Liverpool]|uniref:HEAT repeat-containing protein 1 n=1 Tax=Neospora caninum (strain Liverpool) TaxID=572307 RepID=F0VMY1_NEOCL|nr:conserved hypothetical protein [Neospora caninum Liverpool]CBZ55077.1 conserved hypothetical protein [Neospora caninum Liverpool]CEL69801.1 TPA: U3 small nucleolar RNA-associated protein 10 [Neospora caninum Liverpool]|eukprot:XP_003885105.1 conserved hypothetical protein [Neospora caninum Liverpool]